MFEQLSSGQSPDIFFITCSDSRVIPSLLTQSKPGEQFVLRNVGNIIPPSTTLSGEAAAIEYALEVLPIKDIIICGHSDCGAMKGLLSSTSERLPFVSYWLQHSHSVRDDILHNQSELSEPSKLELTIKKNILAQLEHLKTYPSIAKKLAKKELTLHGWFYEFERGEVLIYDSVQADFVPFDEALKQAIRDRHKTIVQEVAMQYLSNFTHPSTAEEYIALTRAFSKLKDNLNPLWRQIGSEVTQLR